MNKIISTFVALILGAALVVSIDVDAAQLRGKGFYYGARDNKHVADLIAASLAIDSTGKTLLSASECKTKASCGSPIDYFLMFKEADPAGTADLKTVADVPAFVRGLREESAPKGKYIISCVRPDGKGFRPFLACLERTFKPGEKVYVNPISGRSLLASDCGNPIKGPVSPKQVCPEIYFFARTGDTVVRHTPMGSPAFEDDCFAIRKVGETEFHIPWRDDCASVHCTFAANEAHLNKKAWKLASYELEPGEYVVRVPIRFAKSSEYVMAFCIERTKMAWPEFPPEKYTLEQRNEYAKQREQWIEGHSDVVYVWQNAYRIGNDGVPRARIYYTEAEVPASETIKMYWRWGVWFQEHPEQLVR